MKDGSFVLVTQVVEALHYKQEGRGFDSQWCHWNFDIYMSKGYFIIV
jgi:hypothetical protein